MANTALNAIESALKPEVLFAGPYGFSAIDLPNILASSAGGRAASLASISLQKDQKQLL